MVRSIRTAPGVTPTAFNAAASSTSSGIPVIRSPRRTVDPRTTTRSRRRGEPAQDPTTPISYGQARYLLAALDGPRAPKEWQGGLDLDYRIGPGPTTVHLDLDIDYEQIPINDVIAEIPGSVHRTEGGARRALRLLGLRDKDDVSGWRP